MIALTIACEEGRKVVPVGADPKPILRALACQGRRWLVHYEAATPAEQLEWGREDISCRIIAALIAGRPVILESPAGDRRWQAASVEEARRMIGEIEDAISERCYLRLAQDDDDGVAVEVIPVA